MQKSYARDKDKKKIPKERAKVFLKQFKMFIGVERDLIKNSFEDPLKFFSCNPKWPLCRFNLMKQHVIPDEFVFKVE